MDTWNCLKNLPASLITKRFLNYWSIVEAVVVTVALSIFYHRTCGLAYHKNSSMSLQLQSINDSYLGAQQQEQSRKIVTFLSSYLSTSNSSQYSFTANFINDTEIHMSNFGFSYDRETKQLIESQEPSHLKSFDSLLPPPTSFFTRGIMIY